MLTIDNPQPLIIPGIYNYNYRVCCGDPPSLTTPFQFPCLVGYLMTSSDRQRGMGAPVLDLAGFSLTGSSAPSTGVRIRSAPSPSKVFASSSGRNSDGRQPTGMARARAWSPEVENAYRLQLAGFKDMDEYLAMHPTPEVWENSHFFKCLRSKATGKDSRKATPNIIFQPPPPPSTILKASIYIFGHIGSAKTST